MEYIKKIFFIITWPINYLFYKLYNLYMLISNTDTPSGMSHLGVSFGLITLNLITLCKYLWGVFPPYWLFITIIIIAIPYAIPQIADKIRNHFDKESETSRFIGNLAIVVYIFLSVVFFVSVIND